MKRHVATTAAAALTLGACHVHPPVGSPAPIKAPDRATVALADIVNNLKCDMLAFEDNNRYLTALGKSLGGTLTVTIDRNHSAGAGVKIGVPIATGVKLNAGVKASASSAFGETMTIPFVMTFDQANADKIDCPDFKDAQAKPTVHVTSASGVEQNYHLNGPLLNLVGLRHQIDLIYKGNPKIGFVGFNFDGTIVLVDEQRGDLGIDVYFISPSLSTSVSDSFKISYRIGTDWQRILKEGKYIDASGIGGGGGGGFVAADLPPTVVEAAAPPPPPPMPTRADGAPARHHAAPHRTFAAPPPAGVAPAPVPRATRPPPADAAEAQARALMDRLNAPQ